ncbi:hypothetical protein D2Q93_11870 [Alicyclobacillaceae bacterium I2511]|nr:hypothetical protein D2Q93_11870 [Alicyclobacillaceae bacterium I2511]
MKHASNEEVLHKNAHLKIIKLIKHLLCVSEKGSGQTQAVRGGQPQMRTERTFSVREGAFGATTR